MTDWLRSDEGRAYLDCARRTYDIRTAPPRRPTGSRANYLRAKWFRATTHEQREALWALWMKTMLNEPAHTDRDA